jgi:hypothetical protein
MRESSSEIGTVNVGLSCTFRKEEPMASGAKHINCIITWKIRKPYRENGLSLTKNMGAPPECRRSVLLIHCMHSPIRHNVTVR